jgi:Domain of unknown function (DUF1918)
MQRAGSGCEGSSDCRERKGEGIVMNAHVGDRLVPDGDLHRAGMIIEVPNADGSPPYVVKWLSSGHIALVFPGPYTKIIRHEAARPEQSPEVQPS